MATFEFESEASKDISVIIANYNTRELLRCCLGSILQHPSRRSFEVIVVDDASGDQSAQMVREQFSQVQLIANEKNLGYARSNNLAMAKSTGRLIYLLNSDAELLPGALDALAEFFETKPEAGAAGSLLFNDDGSLQASVKAFPSLRSAFFGKRSFLARWLSGSRFVRGELLQWKAGSEEPFQAGYVSSASLMILRSVVQEVGPLDTRLWYFIDADYCKRIWNTGRGVFCVPRAKAIHREHRGGTLSGVKQRFRSVVTFHYGAYIFFRKHGGSRWWHPYHLFVVTGLGVRFAVSLVIQLFKEVAGTDRKVYDS